MFTQTTGHRHRQKVDSINQGVVKRDPVGSFKTKKFTLTNLVSGGIILVFLLEMKRLKVKLLKSNFYN